jgi:hypothetical protein
MFGCTVKIGWSGRDDDQAAGRTAIHRSPPSASTGAAFGSRTMLLNPTRRNTTVYSDRKRPYRTLRRELQNHRCPGRDGDGRLAATARAPRRVARTVSSRRGGAGSAEAQPSHLPAPRDPGRSISRARPGQYCELNTLLDGRVSRPRVRPPRRCHAAGPQDRLLGTHALNWDPTRLGAASPPDRAASPRRR